MGTVKRRLSAIHQTHQLHRFASPTDDARVCTVMSGIRRTKGTAPEAKQPLLGTRDRALLLLDFIGAFRRSELVALDVDDVAEPRDG